MRVESIMNKSGQRKPSLKTAVKAKLKVLQEFRVFDGDDAEAKKEYERKLLEAVAKWPTRDYEIVLDQVGTQFIMDAFSD